MPQINWRFRGHVPYARGGAGKVFHEDLVFVQFEIRKPKSQSANDDVPPDAFVLTGPGRFSDLRDRGRENGPFL